MLAVNWLGNANMRIWKGLGLTTHTLQSLGCQSASGADAVRAQLVQDTADGLRVGEHASDLAHGAIVIDSRELAGVQVSIPVRHVDNEVIILRTGVVELGEEATGVQIVVILVDLAKRITDLKVSLEVIHPVALGAVDWDTAVGAFEMRMSRGACVGSFFSGLGVIGRGRGTGLLVVWVWAEGVLLDVLCASADVWRGRVGERVE